MNMAKSIGDNETLYIVMPAYNEEDNIKNVIKEWYPILKDKNKSSRLVIADAGSTDSTHMILLNLRKEMPQIEILENSGKQHGEKCIALYNYAINNGADYVFQTDSDGQTLASEFSGFWEKRNDVDVVLGNRISREDGRVRAYVEKVVCLLLRMIFNVKVPDANAPFRLMKAEILALYLNRLPVEYNLPNIMLTTFFCYYQEKVMFKEITFRPRGGGINSLNLRKIIRIGIKALRDFVAFRKEMEG